jgi:hypothetical protein
MMLSSDGPLGADAEQWFAVVVKESGPIANGGV